MGVWSGIIALLGVCAQTGILMLTYLDMSYEDMKANGQMNSIADLQVAIVDGTVKRIRPQIMTFLTTAIGLIPIMWAQSFEVGADLMKRIAAPMVGGTLTTFLLGLIVYPAIYYIWKLKFELQPKMNGSSTNQPEERKE
jgi:Cu(I)/Ag(I) efflux system membrane protein CusA/SilA